MSDPQPRRNGRCARKGCRNKLPMLALKDRDAFCSNSCASAYHGVTVTSLLPSGTPGVHRGKAAA